MKYGIHFRHGGTITVESKRTLDEISDFFNEIVNSDTPIRAWGVLADGDEPSALVSIIDVIAVVPAKPAPAPARVRDADGDIWEETKPESGTYALFDRSSIATLAEIKEQYGPVEVLTSPADPA